MIEIPSRQRLLDLAKSLRDAERMGTERDVPEGARFIQMSDTLAGEIARELTLIAGSVERWAKDVLPVTPMPERVCTCAVAGHAPGCPLYPGGGS